MAVLLFVERRGNGSVRVSRLLNVSRAGGFLSCDRELRNPKGFGVGVRVFR
jgi:hypothetical protein